ncbi:APC family amino acid permease [Salmonella enterica subsp. enterica]|uniref:APC family amino acid permease n=1 Tax=Salmonella enterica I TaxID=59201 RepID=A0A3S4IQ00_SALET|nr:APC family amino acid permease [Salmonella enterica subsp. enterica]
MFMFVGCELVTPMAPEIKKAHRNDSQSDGAWPFSGGRLYVPLWRCD